MCNPWVPQPLLISNPLPLHPEGQEERGATFKSIIILQRSCLSLSTAVNQVKDQQNIHWSVEQTYTLIKKAGHKQFFKAHKTVHSLAIYCRCKQKCICFYSQATMNNNNNKNCIRRRNSRFFTISSVHCQPSPTCTLKRPRRNRVQITCNTSSAYHVQHAVLRATWYKGTAQLLRLTVLKSHLFELYFIGWTNNRWRRRGNWSTRRKPLATSFRKCRILKPEDSSPKQDSNPHSSIGGKLWEQTW